MILVNNNFVERKDFCVDIEDRAYQFGDGVYEVIRVYGGKIFALDGHLNRLWRSSQGILISLPFEKDDLKKNLLHLIKLNNIDDGIIYLQVSRGVAPRIHHFPQDVKPLLISYTKKVERPYKLMEEGGKAVTVEDIRWMRCDIKSLNLLGNVLAKQAALERGAVEAILHRGNTVTEGSSSNFFIVSNGLIYTHPADNFILGGITREIVINLISKLKLPFCDRVFTVNEMYKADEAFITSTTSEILPIIDIDGRTVGTGVPGPVTRLIRSAFEEIIGAGSDAENYFTD